MTQYDVKSNLLALFSLVVFPFAVMADGGQDFVFGKHGMSKAKSSEATHEKTVKESLEAPKSEQPLSEPQENKADSTQSAVSKYNFLFYFMYKMKYMEGQYDNEKKPEIKKD